MGEHEFHKPPDRTQEQPRVAPTTLRNRRPLAALVAFGAALGGGIAAGEFKANAEWEEALRQQQETVKANEGLSESEFHALRNLEFLLQTSMEGGIDRYTPEIGEWLQGAEKIRSDAAFRILEELTRHPNEDIARRAVQSLLNRERLLMGERIGEVIRERRQPLLISYDAETTHALVRILHHQYETTNEGSYIEKYPDGFGEANRLALDGLANRGEQGRRALEEWVSTQERMVSRVREVLGQLSERR